MKSVKVHYEKVGRLNPGLSEYTCLAKAVMYKKFSRKTLLKAFNEFVPLDDYITEEKRGLVDHLESLTNGVRRV